MTEFNINELTADQQQKFHRVYEQLAGDHNKYVDYKRRTLHLPHLSENYPSDDGYLKDEANEWKFMIFRHLRARKWDIAETVKSIRATVQWRQENNVDRILYDTTQQELDLVQQFVPCAHHGYTKQHNPIYVEKTGRVNINRCLERFSMQEMVQGHIYMQEFYCRLARQKSRECGQHVEAFVTIMDFDGLELMAGRRAMPLLKELLYVDSNHYPERMGMVFALNTPRFFPILWNLLKGFVDPVTASKVFVVKRDDVARTLLQHIDSDQLPREYHGTCRSCPTAPQCIPLHETFENN